jgi:hypothetical protein
MRNKKELRALVADGQLIDAAQGAFEYAEQASDTETLNGIIALQADLEKSKDLWATNQISFEEYARAQARVTQSLLDRIDELSDEASPKSARGRIKESKFKWLVFYTFITAKLIVFAWAAIMWNLYGFQTGEIFSLFNALLPGLILNASVMFRSLFKTGVEGYAQVRYVPTQFRSLVWVIFPSYILAQIVITILKMHGDLRFETASAAFLAVETGLSLYMNEVVEGLFKKSS